MQSTGTGLGLPPHSAEAVRLAGSEQLSDPPCSKFTAKVQRRSTAFRVGLAERKQTRRVSGVSVTPQTEEQVMPRGTPSTSMW